jgi:hypothetical protein
MVIILHKCKINKSLIDFLRILKKKHTVYIISHKTIKSQFSEKFYLRKEAIKWIKNNLNSIFDTRKIFFFHTKKGKIKKIKSLNIDIFF